MGAYDLGDPKHPDHHAVMSDRWDARDKTDPKPAKRVRADSWEWRRIRFAYKAARCRVCQEPWESLHHLYPRGQGGDDVYENMVPLCGSGTTGCHGLIEAHDPVARAAVRYSLSDQNKWYLTYKLGHRAEGWLDSQYPELLV